MKKFYIAFVLFLFSLPKIFGQAPSITYNIPPSFPAGAAITLSSSNSGGAVPATLYLQATTFAGSGTAGNANGTGTAASFKSPYGTATDAAANIYVADAGNNLIRKITPGAVVSIFAGSGAYGSANGSGTAASFSTPRGITADASGNIYVADQGGNKIRKITQAGVVSILAGNNSAGSLNGTGTAATFNSPYGVATDAAGNVYVADAGNNLIRKINPAGVVTTLAGSGTAGATNGTGTSASFKSPRGVMVDASGNLYVADYGNNLIRKITPAGAVTTFAGSGTAGHTDGTGTTASFDLPAGITADAAGNLYVTDLAYDLIRMVTPAGVVSTIAGTGAAGATNANGIATSFSSPSGISIDALGNLYVADSGNQLIRKVRISGYTISSTLPPGLNFDPYAGIISGTPTTPNLAVNYIITAHNVGGSSSASLNVVITNPLVNAPAIIYNTPQTYTAGSAINPITPSNSGGTVQSAIYLRGTTLAGSGTTGNANGTGTAASFKSPYGTATDAAGNIYVADVGNNLIRKITPNGVVTTLAGSGAYGSSNGTGTAANFSSPRGVAVDVLGNVYVADQGSNKIRKITPAGVVTTLAGSGAVGSTNGTGTSATFNSPYGVAVDAAGNVYVADYGNNLIRKITQAGVVTTLAGSGSVGNANGTGTAASFKSPRGVTTDATGNVYVADYGNSLIREITSAGVVTTLAGNGSAGHADGAGPTASFDLPTAITIDNAGNLYVSDLAYDLVRMVTPAGVVKTIAGTGSAGAVNGTGTSTSFNGPNGISADQAGNLYIGDSANQLIRRVSISGYAISSGLPSGLIFDPTTGTISGTPTTVNLAANCIVTAYNSGGSSATPLSITIARTVVQPPVITYSTPQVYTSGTVINPVSPANTGGTVPATIYLQGTTFAGSGTAGNTNGTGTAASFKLPYGTATDASGNIYVADAGNNLIRKITPAGVVATFAGSGAYGSSNGTGTSANFSSPRGVAVDVLGNVYVADQGSNKIRMITPAGAVTTLAGSGTAGNANGTGAAATFSSPFGVAVDASGNVYVADYTNNLVRKITQAGVVTTLAGSGTAGNTNGTGTAASFKNPKSLTTDAAGNVYVADYGNNLIRKITPDGVVTTLAGSGTAGHTDGIVTSASFDLPTAITADDAGNFYVSDLAYNLVRKISPAGVVTTIAGTGSVGSTNANGTATSFNSPTGISIDAAGNLYAADSGNQLIRRVNTSGYAISPALPAGLTIDSTTGVISGTPTAASAATNYNITAHNEGGSSTAILNITVNNPVVAPGAPNISYPGAEAYTTEVVISPLKPTNSGGKVPATTYGLVSTLAGNFDGGYMDGSGTDVEFYFPYGLTIDASGNVYVADSGNNLIRKVTPQGVTSTFAGNINGGFANGTGTRASFNSPSGVTADASGNLYVADLGNNMIRKITPNGVVTTFAGNGIAGSANGTGIGASFNTPGGVAADASGNIYVADVSNNLIRKITPAGVVSTFAGSGAPGAANGTGTGASFNGPVAVAVDASGNVYVADALNNLVRKITSAGVVSTLAGSGTTGNTNGIGTAAKFNSLSGIAVDALGNVYVTDSDNNLIREITPSGVVSTLAGSGTIDLADGTGVNASFNYPFGICNGLSGSLYVGDAGNNVIRKILTTGYSIAPDLPVGLAFDANTGIITGMPLRPNAATNYTISAYNTLGSSTAKTTITVTKQSAPLTAPQISYAGPKVYTTNTTIAPLGPANSGGAVPATVYSQVTSIAGDANVIGRMNGTGNTATFDFLSGITTDLNDNVYAADNDNDLIRKITPAGVVTTAAGSGETGATDGSGAAASFNNPEDVASDAAGNIYIADASNNVIRKLTPAGVVSTLAGSGAEGNTDGTGIAASFSDPISLTADAAGNVYVGDFGNNVVRKITPSGVVTTLAGNPNFGFSNGTGANATFDGVYSVAVDSLGNVYVADGGNNLIRKVTSAGVVTTLAGNGQQGLVNGPGSSAEFYSPFALTIDPLGNVYELDSYYTFVRKITPAGFVSTLAGNYSAAGIVDSVGTAAGFEGTSGISADAYGNIYVSDSGTIRKITITGYGIDQALPPGLNFDGKTGIISGTPTKTSPAKTYTITAYNLAGSYSTTVSIEVDTLKPNNVVKKTFAVLDQDTPDNDPAAPVVRQAVSPNGDGINDVLLIDGIENYPDNKVTLIDRSGKPVFEIAGYDNVNKVFDGHSNITNIKQQPGTYFYLLEYHDAKSELKRKTGYIIVKY